MSAPASPISNPSPWRDAIGPTASLVEGGGGVTLVDGASFCTCDRSGDIDPSRPHGLFVLDTRLLSRWDLHVAGAPLEPLAVASEAPYQATFVGRVRDWRSPPEHDLVILRRRHVGAGMRERITVRNYDTEAHECTVSLHVDADFAHVFEVKESRAQQRGTKRVEAGPSGLVISRELHGQERTVTVTASMPAEAEPGELRWVLQLPPRGEAELCLEVALAVDGKGQAPRFGCDEANSAPAAHPHEAWRAAAPRFDTDNRRLARAVARATEDLGALRIFDPASPDLPVVAAGAPWFMTLFGRDSLLTAWMALPVDTVLARGVLTTLARYQGDQVDDRTEEEPGRILHEVRLDRASSLALGDGSIYYGTADATPLFVMLAGELHRWGDPTPVAELLPAVDRALEWVEHWGDQDGDGFVEYRRRNPEGLANQGWKDSWDGISFADGTLARAPIALCEVQAYTYAALLDGAMLAEAAGRHDVAQQRRERARRLREAFNRDLWLADRGWFAVGLDADKRPIDSLTSNIGHCLWTGIVDDDKALQLADHLLSPEMATGWGVRTLASSMGRFNPVSYHNGSVWPHDTAICVAGLTRYGFIDHAHRLTEALLDAAGRSNGRLPELFAGLDRREVSTVAAYPASCSPQAWSSAAPLLLARAMLRFDPEAHRGLVHLAPAPPPSVHRLSIGGVRIAGRSVDFAWDAGSTEPEVVGLDGLEIVATPRPPHGEAP